MPNSSKWHLIAGGQMVKMPEHLRMVVREQLVSCETAEMSYLLSLQNFNK